MNAYEILGVAETHSLEEIKTIWKSKVKLYHTDNGGSLEMIQQVNVAWDWLKKNHKQKVVKPTKKYENTFYRLLSFTEGTIELPFEKINEPFAVHFMDGGGKEFRICFDEGAELPKTVKFDMNRKTYIIKLMPDFFMDIDKNLVGK